MFRLFNDLKLAFQSFKKNWVDYLAISFVFSMIVYIGILIGQAITGLLISFIVVIVPAIIGLKFCVFQAYGKSQVEYRSLKIGFLTFFKSIKVYFIVILKPLLIGFFIGLVVYSLFLESALRVATETIPNIMESLVDYDTFYYTYEEMIKISDVKRILDIGKIVSVGSGYLIAFCLKLKRDFIPFLAFEIPINSKRAIAMNNSFLEKKKYFKFLLVNLIILLLFALPAGLAYLTKIGMQANEVFSDNTIGLIMVLVFIVLASPIITLKQLHYVYSYKTYSRPFKEDFNNELKNVIKEMEEIAKKIDKNNQ